LCPVAVLADCAFVLLKVIGVNVLARYVDYLAAFVLLIEHCDVQHATCRKTVSFG
jgi:hypothetical protein